VVSAPEAVSKIKRGNRVFIGTGAASTALDQGHVGDLNLQDIMLYQMLSFTLRNSSTTKRLPSGFP